MVMEKASQKLLGSFADKGVRTRNLIDIYPYQNKAYSTPCSTKSALHLMPSWSADLSIHLLFLAYPTCTCEKRAIY